MDLDKASKLFDAYYFAHGCGRPYQRDDEWLSFFDSIAARIVQDLQPETVLDAGCAMGFLVERLRNRHVQAFGIDISEYAINSTHESIKSYCWVASITDPFPHRYDLIVSIEVLEHMPKEEAETAIVNLCKHTDIILFSSTPFDYKEATHLNVQPPEYWAEQFARHGFYRDVDFDASIITPWAVLFRKTIEPIHLTLRGYERRFWLLWKETQDLRALVTEMREKLVKSDQELTQLQAQRDQDQLRLKELQAQKEQDQLQLQAKTKQIQLLTKDVNSLSTQIREWDKHWAHIQSSSIWRILQATIRVQSRIAPKGSRRYQFTHSALEYSLRIVHKLKRKPTESPNAEAPPSKIDPSIDNLPTSIEPLETNRLKIALYSSDPWTAACAHLRVVGPAHHKGAGIQVLEGTRWHIDPPLNFPEQADVVLIQRDFTRHRDLYHQVIEWAHDSGKPVIYELDDLLTELPNEHPEKDYYADVRTSMLRALTDADAVIVSTLPLAEYARLSNPNTWVLPNYLDDRIWSPVQKSSGYKNFPVSIGYMGGITKTHIPDLESINPILIRLLRRYGNNLRLQFWGVIHPELEKLPNVEFHTEKFPNYVEFARYFTQQACDIFVAPLRNNLFNRCKSPIKFIEYSSLGIPGIYSRITPYESVISQKENGLLASTEEEWETNLTQLIEDPKFRRTVGQAAHKTVTDNFLMSKHAHEWGTIYRSALSARQITRTKNVKS